MYGGRGSDVVYGAEEGLWLLSCEVQDTDMKFNWVNIKFPGGTRPSTVLHHLSLSVSSFNESLCCSLWRSFRYVHTSSILSQL